MSAEQAASPWRDPKVQMSILERRRQDYIDNLRKATQKIIDHYTASDLDVSKEAIFAFMATLGDIEKIALNQVEGEAYLQKLRDFCHQEVMKTMPPTEQHETKFDASKPRLVGTGANRHIDTGAIKMPKSTGIVHQQEFDDKPIEPKPPTTVLGNPIPAESPIVEIPDEIKAAMAKIEEDAKKPDLSDVTKIREVIKTGFEVDELGSDDTVIPAEIVSEEMPVNEADAFFGEKKPTEPYKPLGERVAALLNEAFPSATPEYKTHFFREHTGFPTVAKAEAEVGALTVIDTLKEAIEDAKKSPIEISAPFTVENGHSQNSGTTEPEIRNEPIAPKNQAENAPVSQPSTNALAVVTKNEIVTTKTAMSFRMPTQEQFSYMQQLAKFVAESGYYKDVNTPAKAMVIMMKGFSLNIEPMTALDGIYLVNGRPFISAKLVKGLLEATGLCTRFDIIGDDRKCTVSVQRKGRSEVNTYTFTWDDAVRGGVSTKDTYQKWPKQMLAARTIKRAVDTEFPELSFGLGREDDEEMSDNAEIAAA